MAQRRPVRPNGTQPLSARLALTAQRNDIDLVACARESLHLSPDAGIERERPLPDQQNPRHS
jgi:hypothetical protein